METHAHINKYKGECFYCTQFVPAREGFYYGGVTCSEEVTLNCNSMCLRKYNLLTGNNFATAAEVKAQQRADNAQALADTQAKVRQALIDGGLEACAVKANVRSLAQVIRKVTGADIAIPEMTFDQITDVRNELESRINRKANKEFLDTFKASNTCNRCGGAGRADKWAHTGHVCYKCGGSGKYFN